MATKFLKPHTRIYTRPAPNCPHKQAVERTVTHATEAVAAAGLNHAATAIRPGDRVAIKENGIVVKTGTVLANNLGLYGVKTDDNHFQYYVGCQLVRLARTRRS